MVPDLYGRNLLVERLRPRQHSANAITIRLGGAILAARSSCPTERFALIPLKRPSIEVKVSGYRLNEDDFRAAV